MASIEPFNDLLTWASFNNVDFTSAKADHITGKGVGLIATPSSPNEGHVERTGVFLKIPKQAVLSLEAVKDYAKVDRNFRSLLTALAPQSPRISILLYLLVHLRHPARSQIKAEPVASTPWTNYIKFLPKDVPLPTLWTREERELLAGTSLETAVKAKLAALTRELDNIRDASSDLPFWQAYFWGENAVQVKDWTMVDAWYRSRCLDLPYSGHAMVPCLDLANHSQKPNARYDETTNSDVELLLRPGCSPRVGEEITISYGESKSAAEMLFSYGFIDDDTVSSDISLRLETEEDDPLARAKLHVYDGSPSVQLSRMESGFTWESPFIHLAILNEEDGLNFRLLQDTSGNRELRAFWQDEDVTSQANEFEKLTEGHPLRSIFRLRAVAILQQTVEDHLERMQRQRSPETVDSSMIGEQCANAAALLKKTETLLLKEALDSLEDEKSTLFADPTVQAYLGLTEDTENGKTSPDPALEEPDFS